MTNIATAEAPPNDRLIRESTMLKEKFDNLSKRTAQRRLYTRPDFPKPVEALGDNFFSERQIDAVILVIANEGNG